MVTVLPKMGPKVGATLDEEKMKVHENDCRLLWTMVKPNCIAWVSNWNRSSATAIPNHTPFLYKFASSEVRDANLSAGCMDSTKVFTRLGLSRTKESGASTRTISHEFEVYGVRRGK